MPKVSICIPAYKNPSGMRRALQSVQEQTFVDYEIIITDDSPDNTVEEVVKEFILFKNLHYIKNAVRQGSPQNFNVALLYTKGEYIKILLHDDWFSTPDALGKFVEALDSNPNSYLAFCQSRNINATKNFEWISSPTNHFLSMLRKDPTRLYPRNFIGAPSAVIFRRGSWLFDAKLKWVVDIDFYISILCKHPEIIFLNEPLINITVGDEHQMTSSVHDNKEVELFEFFYLYRKLFSDMQWRWDIFGLFYYLIKKYHVRSLSEIPEADALPGTVKFFLRVFILTPDALSFMQSFRRRPSSRMPSR